MFLKRAYEILFLFEPFDEARHELVRDLGEGSQARVGAYEDGKEVYAIKTYEFQSYTDELYHDI